MGEHLTHSWAHYNPYTGNSLATIPFVGQTTTLQASARTTLGKNLALLMKGSEEFGSSPAVERRSEQLGCKIGRSSVDRIKAGSTPVNLDFIEVLARMFGKKPWQLLHPTMGEQPDEADPAVNLATAVTLVAEKLNNLPEGQRAVAALRLETLAKAPDSEKARAAALVSLTDLGELQAGSPPVDPPTAAAQ